MKIIAIKGGLGNQMFQYAHGRSLELSGKKVTFNISFFEGNKAEKDTARDFKLDNFNIVTKAKFSTKKHLFSEIKSKIKRKIGFNQEGLYQNEKYFKDIKEDIQKEFSPKKPLGEESKIWEEKIKNTPNSVSVHIRRGDYVENKITNNLLGVLPLEYYRQAISFISERKSPPNLFVFSDDIDWVKENFKVNYPIFFVSGPKIRDYEELLLMSKCRDNIIANSSFSWWSAWLNSNPEKIVIAPKIWFKGSPEQSKKIIPEGWVTL
ncbi:MAG: alpha-1,2-fucosyltransferase [bacterium]